jgi:predicted nuclease of predicted toxin-antitoxin system
MQFLANENFPFPSSELLIQDGHIVLLISKENPGISDLEVIEKAMAINSIILTFDKDYGEIIFRHKISKPPAIIFFRFKGALPETAGNILLKLLKKKGINFENRFTVIEETGIRQKVYS